MLLEISPCMNAMLTSRRLKSLGRSAEEGCELCHIFYQLVSVEHEYAQAWARHLEALKHSDSATTSESTTQVMVAIRADHHFSALTTEEAVTQCRLFDTVVLRMGHVTDRTQYDDGNEDDFRSVEFTLYRQTCQYHSSTLMKIWNQLKMFVVNPPICLG